MVEQSQESTSGEVAYHRIRGDIIFGRLAPGQRLRLDAMRAAYQVSVSTLREILSRLGSEGFVVAEGQRGFEVEPVSAEGFREVAALRLLLETNALEAAFAAGDLEWEGRIVAALHKLSVMEQRIGAGDGSVVETWKRYDREFHIALVGACGSEVLLDAHAAVYDKFLRYQMVAVVYRGEIAAREHRQLTDCALRRDIATARQLLRSHVDQCVETALARGDAAWLLPSGRAHASAAPAARRRAALAEAS